MDRVINSYDCRTRFIEIILVFYLHTMFSQNDPWLPYWYNLSETYWKPQESQNTIDSEWFKQRRIDWVMQPVKNVMSKINNHLTELTFFSWLK